jgi:hypothetical protein
MHSPNARPDGPTRRNHLALIILLCVAIIFIFLLYREDDAATINDSEGTAHARTQTAVAVNIDGARLRTSRDPQRTPEQIVSEKVIQFGEQRRDIVLDLAARHNEAVPEEVLRFFDAVEAGDWPETERLFNLMAKRSGQYDNSSPADPTLNHFWPAVLETFGVAEQAHNIPAAELLKFGDDILNTLAPGSVYIGGTDSGRFIPTLLAETSAGDRLIVLTQNALADSRYLEYIQYLYGDRLTLPTDEDAKRIFSEYSADARKRLEHDEQFPDEPRQIRHLENVKRDGDKFEVGGPTAVMDINERLLQFILKKNPDLGFALQESFPLKNTYAQANPSGPIMELRARSENEPLPAAAAEESLNYWRNTAAHIFAETPTEESRKNYSHMAVAHANLLAHQGHPTAAEQTYQTSFQIYPGNVDTLVNYHQFLMQNNRASDAAALLQKFQAQHPNLQAEVKKWLPPKSSLAQ